MSKTALTPTPQQLAAITSSGKSLLVSAAAGSGKTSVLAQRCVHLICDAKPRCNVSQLLVVTFTEAAALEMRGRIDTALRQRLAREPDNAHLIRQLSLIDHAPISTLHAFCSRIIRQNFHRLGLDPAFRVMDGDEAGLLRLEVARDLFMDCYDRPDSAAFHEFIDDFGEGEDEYLIGLLVRTFELLRSLLEPAAWLKNAQQRISEAITKPLEQSDMGREYLALIQSRLGDLQRDIKSAIEAISKMDDLAAYIRYLNELAKASSTWSATLKTSGYDALVAAAAAFALPKLPSISNSIPGKSAAQALIKNIQEQFNDSALRFTAAQWQEGLRSIDSHTRTFISLIEEFARRYHKEKQAARALDFADLERQALTLLSEGPPSKLQPSPVARLFHRQYQHVLVDEYQDINELQDAILTLLSRECLAGSPNSTSNLFCVGDVKQSIYAFRLADPTRFLNRLDAYRPTASHGRVIDLQSNFRSRKPLLDSLNQIFERLMTREAVDIEYDQSHRLHAAASFPPDAKNSFAGSPIELHLLPAKLEEESESHDPAELDAQRSQREAILVARRIQQLMGMHGHPRMEVSQRDPSSALSLRPIEYRDIVILLRATRFHSDDYAQILRQRNIPVFNDNGGGFFDAMEIRDTLSLLRLLDNQRQDIPLAAVLRSPLIGLPDAEDSLARIRLAYPPDIHPIPFHEAATRYAADQDDELAAHLRDFYRDLEGWRTLSRQQPIAQLIWTIYEQTGYLAFTSGLHDGRQRVANLIFLYEKARKFGDFSRQGLYRFNQYLESLREEFDSGQSPQLGEAENAVRIMSIHRSKGLEFPVVFIPELGKRINFQSGQGNILADRRAGLGLTAIDRAKRIRYPSLASVMVAHRLRHQTLAEEMRILYVAMTRAKEHLILTGSCREDAPEAWLSAHVGRAGPLPANLIQGAKTILDWLGPAWAMQPNETAIKLDRHSSSEIREWLESHDPTRPHPPPPESLAQLKPLSPAPDPDPAAEEVIKRLTRQYQFKAFTHLPASEPLAALAKSTSTTPGATRPSPASPSDQSPLADPLFLLGQQPLAPEERGTATHLLLEHLDFSQSSDSLSLQLSKLVECEILSPAQSSAVNLDDLLWLFNSDLGKFLRANAKNLLRELPVNFPYTLSPVPDPAADPLDRTMLRGRIDLLIPDEKGFILLDYKTDDIRSPNLLQTRADFYKPQLALYSDAITKITGRPVHTAHLAFLAARQIITIRYTIPLNG
jgi:ATP-dependent helicase/nuclease subunit A